MKSINPLHIIVLLLAVLLYAWVQLSDAKDELEENKGLYRETLALASSLKEYKKVYANKERMQKSIFTILRQHSLKSAKIKQTTQSGGMTLSSQSMNKAALTSLMAKILNGSYNVHSLHIKKLSETKVSFSMEIKW